MKRRNPYARPDARTRAAKAAGYPARSVFKLKEIDKRFRILRAGDHVLDLGAAPGSWSMFAAERVGDRGSVLAVDLQEISVPLGDRVRVIQGDAMSPDGWLDGETRLFDVVLSDMAPRTSGSKVADRAQSFDLFMGALAVARSVSRPGAHFVAKIFMGEDFPAAKQAVQGAYRTYKATKPAGTRSNSSELYVIGIGFRGE